MLLRMKVWTQQNIIDKDIWALSDRDNVFLPLKWFGQVMNRSTFFLFKLFHECVKQSWDIFAYASYPMYQYGEKSWHKATELNSCWIWNHGQHQHRLQGNSRWIYESLRCDIRWTRSQEATFCLEISKFLVREASSSVSNVSSLLSGCESAVMLLSVLQSSAAMGWCYSSVCES